MMTVESTLPKRPTLRFTVAIFFLVKYLRSISVLATFLVSFLKAFFRFVQTTLILICSVAINNSFTGRSAPRSF